MSIAGPDFLNVATAPAPMGGPCEWCRDGKAVELVEVTPAKIIQRGERAGTVTDPAVKIRACSDCAAKIEVTKADATGAADLEREAKNMNRRMVDKKPTRGERLNHLRRLETEARERGHLRTAQTAARLREQVESDRTGWREERPAA